MKQLYLILAISTLLASAALAQNSMLLPVLVVGNDTFPYSSIPEVTIVSKRTFKDAYDQARFYQLRKNIIAVYPYAKEAGRIYDEIQTELQSREKRKDQKKFIKVREDQLNDIFKDELKNLTVTQGEILVKLISRETGISVYELIREFKSGTAAFYWNKMTQLYGYNLRYTYDPVVERDMEFIMRSLEGYY